MKYRLCYVHNDKWATKWHYSNNVPNIFDDINEAHRYRAAYEQTSRFELVYLVVEEGTDISNLLLPERILI